MSNENDNTNDNKRTVNKLMDTETWDAMKAAGFSEEELTKDQPFGPLVYSYTRKQAIEDGVLVDLTRPGFERLLRLEGIRVHTAVTAAAFAAVVGCSITELARQNLWESLCRVGRMLRAMVGACRQQKDKESTDRVFFTVSGADEQPVELWALCGPGDDAEPVLTIMLKGEDRTMTNVSNTMEARLTMTDQQARTYLRQLGVKCPYCGSEDICGDSIVVDAGRIYQPVSCQSCGEKWHDGYTLDSVADDAGEGEFHNLDAESGEDRP